MNFARNLAKVTNALTNCLRQQAVEPTQVVEASSPQRNHLLLLPDAFAEKVLWTLFSVLTRPRKQPFRAKCLPRRQPEGAGRPICRKCVRRMGVTRGCRWECVPQKGVTEGMHRTVHPLTRPHPLPSGRNCGKSTLDTAPCADASGKTAISGKMLAASAAGRGWMADMPQMRPQDGYCRMGVTIVRQSERLAADELAEDGGRGDGGDFFGRQGDDVVEELQEADGVRVGRGGGVNPP